MKKLVNYFWIELDSKDIKAWNVPASDPQGKVDPTKPCLLPPASVLNTKDLLYSVLAFFNTAGHRAQ